MATFVLVPGFWLGGWAWSAVTRTLRAAGHEVYPVTLTGLGERVHLAGPQIDLDTHITDVVNILTFEDLHHVVLVGHSYAGSVITGVAERMPERIAQLVFVDTAPLPDGVSVADFSDPDEQTSQEKHLAEQGDNWRLPFPAWDEFGDGHELDGLGPNERALMRGRATDMPFNAARQPSRLSNPKRKELPALAIWCTLRSDQVREMVAQGTHMFSELAGPQWTFVDLPTGHWPMFSRPDDLAALLLTVA